MTRLANLFAVRITNWIYPANQPSILPFQVRRFLGDVVLNLLVSLYKVFRK